MSTEETTSFTVKAIVSDGTGEPDTLMALYMPTSSRILAWTSENALLVYDQTVKSWSDTGMELPDDILAPVTTVEFQYSYNGFITRLSDDDTFWMRETAKYNYWADTNIFLPAGTVEIADNIQECDSLGISI